MSKCVNRLAVVVLIGTFPLYNVIIIHIRQFRFFRIPRHWQTSCRAFLTKQYICKCVANLHASGCTDQNSRNILRCPVQGKWHTAYQHQHNIWIDIRDLFEKAALNKPRYHFFSPDCSGLAWQNHHSAAPMITGASVFYYRNPNGFFRKAARGCIRSGKVSTLFHQPRALFGGFSGLLVPVSAFVTSIILIPRAFVNAPFEKITLRVTAASQAAQALPARRSW